MKNHISWSVLIAAAASSVVLAVGCKNDDPRVAQTHTTSGLVEHVDHGDVNAEAVLAIAHARCDRDERCGAVGSGKRYADRERCLSERREQTNAEIAAQQCPQGVKPEPAQACAEALRASSCDLAIENAGSIDTCRASLMCHPVYKP